MVAELPKIDEDDKETPEMTAFPEKVAIKIRYGEQLDEDERKIASKILMAFGQRFYDHTGAMFISGVAGKLDGNGLPEGVFICPTYGADWSSYYKRVPESAS